MRVNTDLPRICDTPLKLLIWGWVGRWLFCDVVPLLFWWLEHLVKSLKFLARSLNLFVKSLNFWRKVRVYLWKV